MMSDANLLYAYAQRSVLGFAELVQSILRPDVPFKRSWNVRAVNYQLKQMEAGGFNRLLLNLPYGYHHTTLIGLARVAWMMGNNPSLRFLIILPEETSRGLVLDEYSECLARLFASPEYSRLFPKTQMTLANGSEFINQHGGGVYMSRARRELPSYKVDHIVVLDADNPCVQMKPQQHSPIAEWCITEAFSKIKSGAEYSIVALNGRKGDRDLNIRLLEGEFGEWQYMEIKVYSYLPTRYQLSDKNGGEFFTFDEDSGLGDDPDASECNQGPDFFNIFFQCIWFSDEFIEHRRSMNES